jgi:hypothetical protein
MMAAHLSAINRRKYLNNRKASPNWYSRSNGHLLD